MKINKNAYKTISLILYFYIKLYIGFLLVKYYIQKDIMRYNLKVNYYITFI